MHSPPLVFDQLRYRTPCANPLGAAWAGSGFSWRADYSGLNEPFNIGWPRNRNDAGDRTPMLGDQHFFSPFYSCEAGTQVVS